MELILKGFLVEMICEGRIEARSRDVLSGKRRDQSNAYFEHKEHLICSNQDVK